MKWIIAALLIIPSMAFAISARSYIVTEMDGRVVIEKNADEVRPIASITKLITAERASRHLLDESIVVLEEDF